MNRFRAAPPLVMLLCLLATACAKDPVATPSPPSLTVSVATPTQQALPRRITASGSVAAWEPISLGVELSGQRVAEVLVEVGDVVAAGQPLLRLDARSLDMELRQAEAALAQAQANLAVASANARRGERLKREQLIAASEADQLVSGELGAQAQRQTAQAQLENARLRRGFATLRSPHAGVVSQRMVQPGQVVAAGAELLSLIRDGRLEWRAELAQADLLRVGEGAAVFVQSPVGGEVPGQVRRVSPALDAQRRIGTIYADLPEPGDLRAGMFAQGRIALGEGSALLVPMDALARRDGRAHVFVVGDDGRVQERVVETGAVFGERIEVRSGLDGSERVVTRGAGFLGDGDLVRVVDAPAATAQPDAGH